MCAVLGDLAPVHCCARLVRCVACAVSWATWLLFTRVLAWCVLSCVRCPGPLCSCSAVCSLVALCCVCGVLRDLAPVHRCARSVRSVVCALSLATWLLLTVVPAWCVVLRVRCPGPLGSCSPVCSLGECCRVCGVLGHSAPVQRCARSLRCVACPVSSATWLLFTGVLAWCVVLGVLCPEPLGSCSPLFPLGTLCCVCGVLGHLAPVHRCTLSVRCVACAVSWATQLLFIGVHAWCIVLRVRCRGPLGSWSPLCPLGALCCVRHVLGHLAPVHRCARSVCCAACAGSLATWLLFTGVPTRCVVLRVWCTRPPSSCSSVCTLGASCCVCQVLGHLAPVHRCARSVCCVAFAGSWATWLLFADVPACCVPLLVRCPRPFGSCSPVCPLSALCCMCGVLGHLAPVHMCALSVCCVARRVSWATWLLFIAVPSRFFVLRVQCPWTLGSFSAVCSLGVLCCVCGVLVSLAPVERCTRSVCCVVCVVSWATQLMFTGVPARCVVSRVRCPGPLGSCSPVCPLGVLCCVCGVLGHLAPVWRSARPVRCVACAMSWATQLLFTCVPGQCVLVRVRCPGPLGSCSSVCPLGVLCCLCGVFGHLTVRRSARPVRCVACAVSWAAWLLFTGPLARWVVLRVRFPGSLGSCSPVCPPAVLCCLCSVLGHLAPFRGCGSSVRCVACAVSWATWLCSPVCPLGVSWCISVCVCVFVVVLLPVQVSLLGAYSSIRTAAIA